MIATGSDFFLFFFCSSSTELALWYINNMAALGGLLGGDKLGLLLANMDGAAGDYRWLLQSVSKGNGV